MTYEFTVILPLRDNEKVSLSVERESVHLQVLAIAGGYSSHEQRGAWIDDTGTVYYDSSECLSTLVDSQEKLDTLRDVAKHWQALLRQEALLVTWREINATFIAETVTTEQAA